MLDQLLTSVSVLLSPEMLLLIFSGAILGTLLGATPGISATLSIALLVPVTYSMGATSGLVFLGAVYCGAIYGASISAILINVPGTPSAVATMIDGYAMTKQGLAGKALGTAAVGSFIGGQAGVFVLLFAAPLVATWALEIGSAEFFWIVVFAMSTVGALGAGSAIKGLMAAAFGLLLGTMGTHPFTGTMRYTFGLPSLYEGIPIVVGLVGLFSISQVLLLSEGNQNKKTFDIKAVGSLLSGLKVPLKYKWTTARSAIIGTFIGTLPGAGADIASFIGYSEAKRASKKPEKFGQGSAEGVLASETANNGVVGGSLIPMLTLGIPGNAVTAALLGGLLIHGIVPGPRLFESDPALLYTFIVSLIFANLAFLVFAFTVIKYFAKVITVPKEILAPVITCLTMAGAITFRGSLDDIWIALALGMVGYIFIKADFPLPPVVLGIILGPLAEENLARVLSMANARNMSILEYFISSKISIVFIVLTLASILFTFWRERGNAKKVCLT